MRRFTIIAAAAFSAASAFGQQAKPMQESDLLKQIGTAPNVTQTSRPSAASTPAAKRKSNDANDSAGAAQEQKGPTEITCTKEATFDNKTHQAVFIGNVHVKDPQFILTSNKLTAFLHDASADKSAPANPVAHSTPSPKPAGSPSPDKNASPGGGLEKAIAEGEVVIIQDKPGENGGPPKHYIGKAQRADYDAKTGDVKLTGWPQVQQGINNQIATDASTVMYLNRDGRMRTEGPCKTVIQEQTE